MSIRYLVLVSIFLFYQSAYGQISFCATIDKYNHHGEIKSSYTAIVSINTTVLENITWIDGTSVDTTFFGTSIFYGDTSTFNDSNGLLYRITKREESKSCFEDLEVIKCKAILVNSSTCSSKTDNMKGFCWKH